AGEPVVVIDVRDPDEYRDGHLEAATNISRGFLEFRVGTAVTDPSTPIVLYCQTGLRSVLAAKALKELGYATVINLQGGYQKWVQSGLPVVREVPMTADQIQRYSRHFLLPQVGDRGQKRLLRSKVLLIGAGGLGSPIALYLAAAGVGTLGLMDGDVVDLTNLQRQVLHTTADIGKPTVESGARRRAERGALLSLSLPHAAAAWPRALLKRGRRPGRAPRSDRAGAGDRGGEAPARDRRAAGRAPPHLRCARHALPRGQAAPRPD